MSVCKKDIILQASLKLFVENGIDATSTAKIAKEARVASGLIFHHFENKEKLVKALYLNIKDEMVNSIRNSVDTSEFTEDKFKQIWLTWITSGLEKMESIRFLHQYNYSRFIKKEVREKGKELFLEYRNFFQDGIEGGILKKLDLEFLSELIFEQSLFVMMYIDENEFDLSRLDELYEVSKDMIFK